MGYFDDVDEWENMTRDKKIFDIKRKIQYLQDILDLMSKEIRVSFYYKGTREIIFVSPETSPIEIITDHGIKIIPKWTLFHLDCKLLTNEELFLPLSQLTDNSAVVLSGVIKCANAR